jgi:deoxyribodipyrimidine photo-lyase
MKKCEAKLETNQSTFRTLDNMTVPEIRIRPINSHPSRATGEYVVYWMTAYRRPFSNFALEHAIECAVELKKPLLIVEALRAAYPFANERIHTFILEGMKDNQRAFDETGATYFPFVEMKAGDGKGLMEHVAKKACVIVSDDWPSFFVPHMQQQLANRIEVKMELVDSNGLFPMHATTRIFTTAHSFRAYLQKNLKNHLHELPLENPLKGVKLKKLTSNPFGTYERANLKFIPQLVQGIDLDHSVKRVNQVGGQVAAMEQMHGFVKSKLAHYSTQRNEPEIEGTSGLSAHLHFGHISTHQIFNQIVAQAKWTTEKITKSRGGSREGWWNMPADVEAFLDQIVTWRELSFNMASHRPIDGHLFESLPPWALASHAKHAKDKREYVYSLEQLELGKTHDPLWNAIQTQLVQDGWFHGYLRMLWGKKILEWSASAQEALTKMEHLMGKYSLDGRDPVSVSGYLWVLGRYDRAWGPERNIFGKIRYMSSVNTAKKVNVKKYVARYSPTKSM